MSISLPSNARTLLLDDSDHEMRIAHAPPTGHPAVVWANIWRSAMPVEEIRRAVLDVCPGMGPYMRSIHSGEWTFLVHLHWMLSRLDILYAIESAMMRHMRERHADVETMITRRGTPTVLPNMSSE